MHALTIGDSITFLLNNFDHELHNRRAMTSTRCEWFISVCSQNQTTKLYRKWSEELLSNELPVRIFCVQRVEISKAISLSRSFTLAHCAGV